VQATPNVKLTAEELDFLTKRTQDGGTEVVQAKAGKVGALASTNQLIQNLPIVHIFNTLHSQRFNCQVLS
jgi:malate/lactate dehydrogenase